MPVGDWAFMAAAVGAGRAGRMEAADTCSDPDVVVAGEAPKAEVVAEGDAEWDEGVGRFLGEAMDEGAGGWLVCRGGGRLAMPGSILGAMLEADRRA